MPILLYFIQMHISLHLFLQAPHECSGTFAKDIGVRARGERETAAPSKFWATQIFGAAREIWAKPVFKDVQAFF